MKNFSLFAVTPVTILILGCTTASPIANRQWWVPMETVQREGKPLDHVIVLEELPADRPYVVIGTVSPEGENFSSWGVAVNKMRSVAARHGADAIIPDRRRFQAKAIVWK